jgi:hypothetical protein
LRGCAVVALTACEEDDRVGLWFWKQAPWGSVVSGEFPILPA